MPRTGFRSLFVVLVACLALAACSDSDGPTEPTGPTLGQAFMLRAGESVTLRGEPVRITFESILSDSRCPITALCVWAGEARGRFFLSVGVGSPHPFELTTLEERTAEVSGYRVRLDFVLPASTGTPIPPGDYVAQLVITR
jgi:hypothetical protein